MFKKIGEILDELTEGILGLFIGFIIFLISITAFVGMIVLIGALL
tara:strand:- start:1362 stop:1496 length:135 start_codon:yes stop_codon:yes gene_type:complete